MRKDSAPRQGAHWDDGLIARRAQGPQDTEEPAREDVPRQPGPRQHPARPEAAAAPALPSAPPAAEPEAPPAPRYPPVPEQDDGAPDRTLRTRLGALRELIALSRTRLGGPVLAEAGRVLDAAAARERLPRTYTVVALAGATGSGKSTLFNALAGAQLSEAGVRRPTTATAVSCAWEADTGLGPEGLLERLGVPYRARRRAPAADPPLRGLVLLDLPDHDSIAHGHREQADRLLSLVDAVIWVVDPEKYADAVLHERYLGAFAGHAEVSFVVLNQTDRLPGDAADAVLDDLRRLLDERGIALGEHGEPGAAVLAVSALTGEGVPELRRRVGELVSARTAAARRLAADVDGAARRLRPVYMAESVQAPEGLTAQVQEEFADGLATAVGAGAAGRAAERAWLRRAERVCGTPWTQVWRRMAQWRAAARGAPPALGTGQCRLAAPPAVSRPAVDGAVRRLTDGVAAELPRPWAKTVRNAARRGAEGLPRALEAALAERWREEVTGAPPEDEAVSYDETGAAAWPAQRSRPGRPGWWTVAAAGQAALLVAQLMGAGWLLLALVGRPVVDPWLPPTLWACGLLGAPLLAWICRLASRAPAREWGGAEELRLRRLAEACGRHLVLTPVAVELERYREVREQYVIAAGGGPDPECGGGL